MTGEKLVELALQYLDFPGSNYQGRYLGRDERGFDCSGFLTFLLERLKFPKPKWIRYCN